MKGFARITAATDFSEIGNAAVQRAFTLCSEASARIDLVHVVERVSEPNPLYAHYELGSHDPAVHDAVVAKARAALEAMIPAGVRAAGASVTTHVRAGDPAKEILVVAGETGADLVVVATHGRTGIERLLLGSVAERVVRLAHCSVLVVRR